jgi:hypothetical protein
LGSTENISVVSRSSIHSNACKKRDSSTCYFCGYAEPDENDGLEAAHLAEYGTYKAMTVSKRDAFLQRLELYSIHDIINLITLCENCRKYFDKKGGYNIAIEPTSKKLIVAKGIHEKTNRFCNKKFAELHGKQIVFTGSQHYQPTAKLLEYRFELFTENIVDCQSLQMDFRNRAVVMLSNQVISMIICDFIFLR